MASLNQASIIGYVGDDPKIISTQTQRKMAALSVGTTERGYTTKDNKVVPDRTEWHSVVAFGRLAEIVEMYVRKGSLIFVQGRLATRAYDKDGQKHYVTEIVADSMQMLDRKTSDSPQATQQLPTHQSNDFGPF